MTSTLMRELARLFVVEGVNHEDDLEANRLLAIGDDLEFRALGQPDESGAFKTCSMCDAPITAEQWSALPICGVMHVGAGAPDLELRNHDCGSTLAVEVAA